MKFSYNQSVKTEIEQDLYLCRQLTLNIFEQLELEQFSQQAHPDFSPIGWHLGHIAFTEAYWILERLAGNEPIFTEYKRLFAADGLPKAERQNLPSPQFIRDYLHIVRDKVLVYLEKAPFVQQERLWRWLLQHESQHGETIEIILHLLGVRTAKTQFHLPPPIPTMVEIPAGEFLLGSEEIYSQDNERPINLVYVDSYYLAQYPVTCAEYDQFMLSGGYDHPHWWSKPGWLWKQSHSITQPLYWDETCINSYTPVYGVSYYEAEAYARFVGKRLPTEIEWEKAARWNHQAQQQYLYPWGDHLPNANYCNYHLNLRQTTPVNAYPLGKSPTGCEDLLGNVWEWTCSDFSGYPGFVSYPYHGYSQAYFDGQHKVLRGGSWATRSWALRASFRNWYNMGVRQILAGFRCAS
ncbi:MAG: ergothioneine biosynthesis protein EgtB [Gloeocapsa sp. DLM2.Bin57]|nr:MAG: ergothioneine biosynthesis protein EgtB [Gloeocapsa sp. DLM2.Bin57]